MQKTNSQNTARADFLVYHYLKFKTRLKQNLSCSKHGGGKPQGSNVLVEAVDMPVLPKKGCTETRGIKGAPWAPHFFFLFKRGELWCQG